MSSSSAPRRSRVRGAVIVAVLAVVVVAVVVIALVTGGAAKPGAATTSSPTATAAPVPTTTSAPTTTTPSATATPTAAPTAPKPAEDEPTTASSPQPTRTAAISSSAPIVKSLAAKVTKMEAVTGKAEGPGEIAGPSVRFTIAITNTTGASVDLRSTVVNAYSGSAATPALELQNPGGKPFPHAVPNGGSVTGVFVFNIPAAQRGHVEVTVDTSVRNPVVAFKGSAPR